MNRLTTEQSNLLKRLQEGSLLFSDLSAEDQEITRHLKDLGYVTTTSSTHSQSSGGVFQLWEEIDTVSISETGKMYLLNEKFSVDEYLFLQNQMNSLKTLAETAVADSESSRKDSRFSKTVSIIAIIISIIAIIVPVLMQIL